MPYWRLFYHLVWATKNRAPLLIGDMFETVERSIRATCHEHRALPHAVGGMPDHIHLVVSIPPSIAIATLVGRLKGSSSHLLNHQGRRTDDSDFAWQSEYGVLSFSEKALPTIIAYVQNQPAHHADNTLWPGLERITESPPSRRLNPSSLRAEPTTYDDFPAIDDLDTSDAPANPFQPGARANRWPRA